MLFLLTLSFSSAVAGSETAAASDGLTRLVTEYANKHIPRGDLVVGVHAQDSVRWYTSGSLTPDTTFEIGSITKALTGMLLAEQIASGRVEPTTTVRELWPAGPQAAASGIPELPEHLAGITLTQLATHTSGLPRLNLASWRFIRTFLHLDNPYAHLTTADMYRDAASASIEQPGAFRYSNLGFALLGRLLVEVAAPQTPSTAGFAAEYSDTVNEQVLTPLSLPEFMPGAATRLPDSYTANGRRAASWEFDGYAAAGGLTSTAADVLQFAKQLHHLPPAFRAAIQPQAEVSDTRMIGYGWFLERLENGETLIWHNGGTGGFSSFVGAVPERNVTIGVFSNSAVSVDGLARAIVRNQAAAPPPGTTALFHWVIGAGLLLWIVGFILVRIPSTITRRFRRRSRSDLVHIGTETASAVFVLSIWARSAPAALYIPGLELVFLAAIAVVTGMEMVAMNRSGSLPIFSSNRTPWLTVGGVTQIILFSTLAVLLW